MRCLIGFYQGGLRPFMKIQTEGTAFSIELHGGRKGTGELHGKTWEEFGRQYRIWGQSAELQLVLGRLAFSRKIKVEDLEWVKQV